jgi:integrase
MHTARAGGGCSCADPACPDPGKHPRLRGWQRLATADPVVVGEWWRRWPEANLGLATGRQFDVLDLDGTQGVEALRAVLSIAPTEHPGPVARTGGGGWHLLYAPTGLGNRVRLAPGVDWRGRDGLIVAPPSQHTSGHRYTWVRPLTAGLSEVPAALRRLLAPRQVRVKRVAVPKRPPTVYSPEQTGSFLAVAAGDRLAAMWVLLVTSGMRPSEVLGLPWAAVDLEAGLLSIYQKLIKVENHAVIADGTKVDHTGAAVAQVIVLAPVAATMLRAWRIAQIEERRLWPWRKDYNELVFTREDGTPLKPDWLNRRFKQLARQAGLPDGVRVYDLRHGWATAALRAGVHPKLVQEVMRHSSYSTTADTYTHVMPAHSAEAVRTVAALFETPSRLALPPTAEAPDEP